MENKTNFPYIQAPYEDETNQYMKSFSLNQKEEIKQFFDTYGFVVVRDVLTTQECEISKQEVWVELQSNSFKEIDQNNLQSLENVDRFCRNFGLVGGGNPVILPQSIKNRLNQNIYESYCAATGKNNFLTAFERYGFMRPTKDHPDWSTLKNWLHIDMNPLTGRTSVYGYLPSKQLEPYQKQYSYQQVQNIPWQHAYFQGIVALEDCPEGTGGLNLVPGFQKHVFDWAQQQKDFCIDAHRQEPTTVSIPIDDEMQAHIQKIPIRKGSLAIWDGRLPHSNFPNTSDKPRYVQYIKYNAVDEGIFSQVSSQYPDIQQEIQQIKDLEISQLGYKLLGIKPWV